MISFELSNTSQWLPILLVPLVFIVIVGLSCWYRHRKKETKIIPRAKPFGRLPSTKEMIPAIPSFQLTNTDKIYLDKLVRTASDRSMWKGEMSSKKIGDEKKLRKVPSGLLEEKS